MSPDARTAEDCIAKNEQTIRHLREEHFEIQRKLAMRNNSLSLTMTELERVRHEEFAINLLNERMDRWAFMNGLEHLPQEKMQQEFIKYLKYDRSNLFPRG